MHYRTMTAGHTLYLPGTPPYPRLSPTLPAILLSLG